MAIFNQQGQVVSAQYNAETINFSGFKSRKDVIFELRQFQNELGKASEQIAFDNKVAAEVEVFINQVIIHAESERPDKKTMIQYLASAKDLVVGVTGFAAAIKGFMVAVESFF